MKRLALCLTLLTACVAATPASAASTLPDELLTTIGSGSGPGANELNEPNGIAASPNKPGHVYVADDVNHRVSEFTAWGEFVKAFGWGVADGTSNELQTCTTTCFEGISGSGAGQFKEVNGIAVDAAGDIYVFDIRNLRLQKFDPAGDFLLMLGGEVNKTTGADICTRAQLEGGDVCGEGVSGAGPGEFHIDDLTGVRGGYLTIGPANKIYVGDKDRIQEFKPDGSFKAEIPLPHPGNPGALAADPSSGDLYFAFADGFFGGSPIEPDVYRLDPVTGEVIDRLEVQRPTALAVDGDGNVFVVNEWYGAHPPTHPELPSHLIPEVLEFDSDGNEVLGLDSGFASPPIEGIMLKGLGTNVVGDVYVGTANFSSPNNFVKVFGPPPIALDDPPNFPPTVTSQYAVSVGRSTASVRAAINPNYWADTTYYVQYGTEDCELGGCAEQPAAPGPRLTTKVAKSPLTSASVSLPGLQPDTTYHYRFVAQSSGGGPSFGADRTFTTPAARAAETACANQAFRIGAAALLPDCRAYEMVSPVDKGGGDILTLCESLCLPSALNQSAAAGGKLTYSSFRAFANPQSAPYTSQYMAGRTGAGWSNESISPPRSDVSLLLALDTHYRGFSSDLSSGWVWGDTALALAPEAATPNIYRRDNTTGSYEPLVPEAIDANQGPRRLELQGFSSGASDAIIRDNARLTPDAAKAKGIIQVYLASGGELHLVSVKPDGTASSVSSSAGSRGSSADGRRGNMTHALSADADQVFWSEFIPGTQTAAAMELLYLRKNPTQPQSPQALGSATGTGTLAPGSTTVTKAKATTGAFAVGQTITAPGIPFGTTIAAVGAETLTLSAPATVTKKEAFALSAFSECTEPNQACTVPISKGAAQFHAASADGSKAIFSETVGDKLLEYDAATETATPIASAVRGVMGVSDDASHVYFVSKEALDGAAVAGQPNLYLAEDGEVGFIATLSEVDASGALSPIAAAPVFRSSRITPDGEQAVFMSTASLTGYDNADASNGKPAAEVFRYDATTSGGAGELKCVSCMPSGAVPSGRQLVLQQSPKATWIAAQIPGWASQLYASRVLSDDGDRLYFNSYDPLVPEDTNARQDVYQWQAPGKGNCTEADPTFHASAGGCVDLISSGTSPQDSEFIDASAEGTDVFFSTTASLLPQDPPGQIDIYDARVGGGFPPAPPAPRPCEGEACQAPATVPPYSPPASLTFNGPGNTKERAKAEKHAKKKQKKSKQRKQKSKKHQGKRQASGKTAR